MEKEYEYVYSIQKIETFTLCEKCKLRFTTSHEWRQHDKSVHDVKDHSSSTIRTKGLDKYGRKLK